MSKFNNEICRRLAAWASGIPSPPLRLLMGITHRCNLECLFCNVQTKVRMEKSEMAELSLNQWLRIVEEAQRMGVKEWWCSGIGEPLFFREKLASIFIRIKSLDPSSFCHLTTSGILFTPEIIKTFVGIGMDEVNFSVDAPDRETYEFLRNKKGAYEQVITNLRLFKKTKEKLNSDYPTISFTLVLTSRNHFLLREMVDLACELGVTKITINPMRINSVNLENVERFNMRIKPKQRDKVIQNLGRAEVYAKKNGILLHLNSWKELEMGPCAVDSAEGFLQERNNISQQLKGRNKFMEAPCFEPWYTIMIDPYGRAGFCPSGLTKWMRKTNLVEKSLEEVWYGPYFSNARRLILAHRPFEQCLGCGIKSLRKHISIELKEYLKNQEHTR